MIRNQVVNVFWRLLKSEQKIEGLKMTTFAIILSILIEYHSVIFGQSHASGTHFSLSICYPIISYNFGGFPPIWDVYKYIFFYLVVKNIIVLINIFSMSRLGFPK